MQSAAVDKSDVNKLPNTWQFRQKNVSLTQHSALSTQHSIFTKFAGLPFN